VPCADSSPSTRPRLEPKAKIPNHEGTRLRFALDSLLEGDGFELPVPRENGYPVEPSYFAHLIEMFEFCRRASFA